MVKRWRLLLVAIVSQQSIALRSSDDRPRKHSDANLLKRYHTPVCDSAHHHQHMREADYVQDGARKNDPILWNDSRRRQLSSMNMKTWIAAGKVVWTAPM